MFMSLKEAGIESSGQALLTITIQLISLKEAGEVKEELKVQVKRCSPKARHVWFECAALSNK